MTRITKALIWAAAIFALALANYLGVVADDVAQTMFVTLPVLAWLTISDQRGCMSCLPRPNDGEQRA